MYKVKLWFTGQNIEHSTTIEIEIDIELINDEKTDMVQTAESITTFFELE